MRAYGRDPWPLFLPYYPIRLGLLLYVCHQLFLLPLQISAFAVNVAVLRLMDRWYSFMRCAGVFEVPNNASIPLG